MSQSLDLRVSEDIANQGLERLSRHESRASRHSKRNDDVQGLQEALELRHSRLAGPEDAEPGLPEVAEEEMTNVASIEPIPPNGGYGWVCTLAVFLINSHTWGVNASWAVIMAHYSLHSDKIKASHLEFGLVGGLSISQALLISPIVPSVRKRIGTKPTLLLGTMLIFISLLASSFATQIWHLFLSQGFCFGWGMGFAFGTAASLLPPWFTSRRSLAYGIATSGAGVGGLIYSISANAIIENMGVEWAYRILAICSLCSNLLASFLLKEWGGRSEAVRNEPRFNPKDFGRVEVLLIIIWGVVTELGYIILLFSLPTYASSIGLTSTQGSISSALFNVGLAVARPLTGYFSDTFGRINIAGLLTLLCSISCFALWIPTASYAPLLAFSLISGALCGTFWATITPVLAEIVGIRKLASTFGVICLALVPPTTFAEPMAVSMVGGHETTSFTNAQVFVGFMFLTGALSVWFLRAWKISDDEMERHANASLGGLPERPLRTGKKSKYWVAWLTPRLLFSSGIV